MVVLSRKSWLDYVKIYVFACVSYLYVPATRLATYSKAPRYRCPTTKIGNYLDGLPFSSSLLKYMMVDNKNLSRLHCNDMKKSRLKFIWKSLLLPKEHVFVWTCLVGVLPMGVVIQARKNSLTICKHVTTLMKACSIYSEPVQSHIVSY